MIVMGTPVIRMRKLAAQFENRLIELGEKDISRIKLARLRNEILEHMPELTSYVESRSLYLAASDDIAKGR